VITIEVLPCIPAVSIAVAVIVCVPGALRYRHVSEQEVVLVHVLRIVLSAAMVIDAMPLVSVAETAILTLK
jgi:hypothetical protein